MYGIDWALQPRATPGQVARIRLLAAEWTRSPFPLEVFAGETFGREIADLYQLTELEAESLMARLEGMHR